MSQHKTTEMYQQKKKRLQVQ